MRYNMTVEEKVIQFIRKIETEKYNEGIEVGLRVAEKIRAWLTRQPDTRRQREVRGWADQEIARVLRIIRPSDKKEEA